MHMLYSYCRFKFPSVFIIYIILSAGMTIFLDLLGNFDLKSMFCSSHDLIKSLENPTIYCTLSGIIIYTSQECIFKIKERGSAYNFNFFLKPTESPACTK